MFCVDINPPYCDANVLPRRKVGEAFIWRGHVLAFYSTISIIKSVPNHILSTPGTSVINLIPEVEIFVDEKVIEFIKLKNQPKPGFLFKGFVHEGVNWDKFFNQFKKFVKIASPDFYEPKKINLQDLEFYRALSKVYDV